ncbi:MAG: siderophore ABC transporter substrate-binding protein [Thermomicrobiales bacterium]|nr:siderophore ABC transporter substrate-binding protein [Thermomicrobiales bacterium]
MSLEMNRRTVLKYAGGTAALFAAGGFGRLAFAQDATPSAEAEVIISVVEGPGEGELTVTHAQGETVVKVNPEKIVSFDVASIQTIEFLGGTLAGVPELELSGEGLSSTDAEVVGSLFEPDYEAINAMQPDLIIVAARSAAAYPDLSKIAPTIDVSFGAHMVDSLHQVSTVIATILGKEAEAEAALADIDARVAALQAVAADAGTGMVIMVSGGAVSALAPGNARGGRGALIYDVLDIQPPIEDLETATHGEPISFEFLLEHDPDWLFVIDRDVATGEAEAGSSPAEEVLDNDIVHQTTAYQNDQIVYVNPFDWYIITGAGIPSMDRMLTEIETAFGV